MQRESYQVIEVKALENGMVSTQGCLGRSFLDKESGLPIARFLEKKTQPPVKEAHYSPEVRIQIANLCQGNLGNVFVRWPNGKYEKAN